MVLGRRDLYTAKTLKSPSLVEQGTKRSGSFRKLPISPLDSRSQTKPSISIRESKYSSSSLVDRHQIKRSFSPLVDEQKNKQVNLGKAERSISSLASCADALWARHAFLPRDSKLLSSRTLVDQVKSKQSISHRESKLLNSHFVEDKTKQSITHRESKPLRSRQETNKSSSSLDRGDAHQGSKESILPRQRSLHLERSQSLDQYKKVDWKCKVKTRSQPFISVWQKFEKGAPPSWFGRSEEKRLEQEALDFCEDTLDEIRRSLQQTEFDFSVLHKQVAAIRQKMPKLRCSNDTD